LTFFEGLHTRFYLIYLTPLYCVLCAIAGYWFWTRRPLSRLAIGALAVILIVSQTARTAILPWRNPKRSDWTPAGEYIAQQVDHDGLVMGNGGVMFGLGPEWKLIDDFRLGYNSGKRPGAVVLDESWRDRMGVLREEHPEIWAHVQSVLTNCRGVYENH